MVEAPGKGEYQSIPKTEDHSNMSMDQFIAESGMHAGPDDRASLISSITNGPMVEMEHEAKLSNRDQTIRIGMIGNQGVGKTSLLRRFVKNEPQSPATAQSTFGYDDNTYQLKVRINGEPFNVKFGDTAGQERYNALAKNYFQMHDALVVVFDMTNPKTLEGAMRWVKQIKDVKIMPLILVGNKAEMEEYRILSD